jgi:hypothetical protein
MTGRTKTADIDVFKVQRRMCATTCNYEQSLGRLLTARRMRRRAYLHQHRRQFRARLPKALAGCEDTLVGRARV